MTIRLLLFALLVGSLLALPTTARCASLARTVTITDYLGVDWQDDLVHYTLVFPQGAVKGVADAQVMTGGKAIPSQVSDVQRHADGSVRSMNVWFFATVPANGAASYTITPGKKGPADAGVTVKTTPDSIELTTNAPRKIGIRLLNGAKTYAWPIPAAQAPGPIQSLLLPSGRTTGKGRFEVPFAVKSYHSEITAAGPLFAEVKVHYLFETGYWTLTARVLRGSPLIQIREELDNGMHEEHFDLINTPRNIDRFYSFVINGEGFKPTQAFFLGRVDTPEYSKLLNQETQPEVKAVMGQPTVSGTCANGYDLSFAQNRTDYFLIGWPSWSPRNGVGIRFIEPGKDAVGFIAVQTPFWRNQMSVRFRVNTAGEVIAGLPLQVYEQGWETDGYGRTSPNATGRTTEVPDSAARRCYGIMLTTAENEVDGKLGSLLRASAKVGAWPLDEVKDWLLDLPDPMAKAAWATETSKEGQSIIARMKKWLAAKRAAGNFGMYSMHDHFFISQWRSKDGMGGQADLKEVIDNPQLITAADRKFLRRIAAYQAYVANSPESFPWGVGCHLGNPNMSIMAMNARVYAAQIVKDHPLYNTWGAWSVAFMKEYINRFTRESGAAYECPSYTLGVTLKQLADANAFLLDAGVGDAMETKRFADGMRFTFNWLLPPDLRFSGKRQIMPVGNTSYQSVPPELATHVVKYYQQRNPELAGQFQWFANQTLPEKEQLKLVKDITPDLGSAWVKDYGVVMRHGFGTPYETYFHMMAGNCLGHYETTDHMVYTLYAKGQPINMHFGNGYFPMYSRPWLRNGISVDHRVHWAFERLYAKVETAAFMPPVEYARAALDIDELLAKCGEYPPDYGKPDPDPLVMHTAEKMPMMTWYRQVLFLKDADPKGPNYFVIRDTFGGKPTKPTDASFWFLANSMEKRGDVYHFDGQLPVDMDVFVNTPAGAEPETGKFGHVQQPYGRKVADDLKYYPNKARREDQLFLRLKQPAGGGYFVVLYPRLKGADPAAVFTSLGENAVKVDTTLSTDYIFANAFPITVKDPRVEFTGTAGAVRFYADGKIVVANNEGNATFRVAGKTITGSGAFTVTITGGKVETKPFGEGATVDVK
ncbi:MAG: hypothetical protein ACYC7E_13795 [Armatimonadota bacterium]